MNWHALDWSILGLPLIAGLLVLATHVPLGTQVLDRGIVFIDLAIAQIAGLGVIAADALGLPEGGVAVQAAAVSAALLGAALLTWTERRAAAAAGGADRRVVHPRRLRRHPAAGRQPARRRAPEGPAGRPDPVGRQRAARLAGAGVGARAGGRCAPVSRDASAASASTALFALAVTASVQLVGVYLVFSSLIIPALATRSFAIRRRPLVGLRARRRRLRARPGAVGAVRPAVGCGDRLGTGRLWFSRGSVARPARDALIPRYGGCVCIVARAVPA